MTAVARMRVEMLAAIAIVYGACFVVLASTPARPLIGAAVMIDLTVTSSLVVWWLGIRRRAFGWWAVPVTCVVGLAVVRAAVPAAPWSIVIGASIVAEGVAFVFVGLRVRMIIRAAREVRGRGPIVALEAGLRAAHVPARFASFAATEVGVFWLALTGWFRTRAANAMTMHRTSSALVVYGVLVVLVAGETAVMHLLIAMWSVTAAWIATALSIYSVVWVVGHAHALRLYAIIIEATHVHIAVGVRWRVSLPKAAIALVTRTESTPKDALALSKLPTLLVTLREPVTAHGVFGITRTTSRIALAADDPDAFIAALTS